MPIKNARPFLSCGCQGFCLGAQVHSITYAGETELPFDSGYCDLCKAFGDDLLPDSEGRIICGMCGGEGVRV